MVEQEVLRVVRPAAVEAAMQAHQEMVAGKTAGVAVWAGSRESIPSPNPGLPD